MLVLTPHRLMLIVAGSCLLLPPLLGVLAKNRGRNVLTWVLLGALPLINIGALIILLWTPLLAEQETLREREKKWREVMKESDTGRHQAVGSPPHKNTDKK